MKLNKRTLRWTLAAAVSAAVSAPLLNPLWNSRVTAQPAPAPAQPPAADQQPGGAVVNAFPQVDPGKVVITIGDQKITAGEFNTFFSDLDPNVQQQVLSRPEAKRQLVDRYVDMKLLAADAKRQKLDETPKVKTMYEQVLANAAMLHLMEQKDANQKFFDENKGWFDELQVRHILIGVAGGGVGSATLDDAQAKAKAESLRKQLDKAPDEFPTLARANSDDKGSAAVGGSLGTMRRGQMVPAFEQVAYDLKAGDTSQPVKTQFGYHIIQVLRRTPVNYAQAADRVPSRRAEVILDQLKKAAHPEIDDSYFGAGPSTTEKAESTAKPATPTASGK